MEWITEKFSDMEWITEKFSYEWTFSEACTYSNIPNKIAESPNFPKSSNICYWKIKLQQKLTNEYEKSSRFLLECVKQRRFSEEVWALYQVTFFSNNLKKLVLSDQLKKFSESKTEHLIADWDLSLLNAVFVSQSVGSSKSIRIRIDIDVKTAKQNKVQLGKKRSHENLLADDIAACLNDSKYSDITICVGDAKLKAHRLILTTRSAVFAATLKHNTREKNSGCIVISDFDVDVVRTFLRYIYSDFVEIPNYEMALNLFRIADKYAVEGLKVLSSNYLETTMNEVNCIDVLLLAEMHGASSLKKHAINFYLRLPKSVANSISYKKIEEKQPSLLSELLKEVWAKGSNDSSSA